MRTRGHVGKAVRITRLEVSVAVSSTESQLQYFIDILVMQGVRCANAGEGCAVLHTIGQAVGHMTMRA